MLVNLPLLSINKSIFVAKMPISSPLQLLVSSLKRNLRRGFTVTYLKIKGLRVELLFNKNIIKPGDDKKYIKKTINTIAILRIK